MAKDSPEGSASELVKLYYRIGEVSKIVGVAPHVLRYWETEFRSIRPQKSNRGQRVYSRRDVAKLLHVKDLLRNQGFTIAGAKKRLRPRGSVNEPAAASVESPGSSESPAHSAAPGVPEAPTSSGYIGPFPAEAARDSDPGNAVAFASNDLNATSETAGDAKSMRRALVGLRRDLVAWLSELVESETAGRPAEDKQ